MLGYLRIELDEIDKQTFFSAIGRIASLAEMSPRDCKGD